MGAALGFLLFQLPLLQLLSGALLLGVPMVLVAAALIYTITERVGDSAGGLFHPSAQLASPIRDYSREEALILRGRIDEAMDALRLAAEENPSDPRPSLRIAHLLRDEIGAHDEALEWFERAASIPGLPEAEQLYILRELVELCQSKLGAPERATPFLAKVARLQQGMGVGDWAHREIREIKAEMRAQRRD